MMVVSIRSDRFTEAGNLNDHKQFNIQLKLKKFEHFKRVFKNAQTFRIQNSIWLN